MFLTVINPENSLAIWTFLVAIAAFSIVIEQKYKWASRISGCVLAMATAALLSNTGILPHKSGVYDNVWGFIVPVAVPLLLFKSNLFKIWKESGRLVVIFIICAAGTVLGGITGHFILNKEFVDLFKTTAMLTGSYIGGSVNFAAISDTFDTPADIVSAAVVADNLVMALFFILLMAISGMKFFLRYYRHPLIDKNEKLKQDNLLTASYWKKKEISLRDISLSISLSLIIVFVSDTISVFITENFLTGQSNVFVEVISNKYLLITTITIMLTSLFPSLFDGLNGAMEIGTFFIYVFFVVIGISASVAMIVQNSPLLLVYCLIIVLINLLTGLIAGKLFGFSLEEIIMASNANIGGPTTAAAMAIAKGWHSLVVPVMLVGTLGYIIGNYAGISLGLFLK